MHEQNIVGAINSKSFHPSTGAVYMVHFASEWINSFDHL